MTESLRLLAAALDDRWAVDGELGRGATSIVYRARDRETGELVAIKVLRRELAESLSADRFVREIRFTQNLDHPSIVPIVNSGIVDGAPYCVMPLMDGGTLRARLDREKQLPVKDVVAIGSHIARALDFAHSRKLIHRDVKPENILFSGGEARLADFGIARALEDATGGTTSTGIVRGTPAYMSPEQASGERDLDGRTDIFSLACVLYEALAGVPAYVGPTSQSVAAQRLVHAPRPVSVYRPTVGDAMESVLAHALSLAPSDRYATAGDFANALEHAALESPRTTTKTVASKRRPIAVAAGLIIVAFAGLLLWNARLPFQTSKTLPLDTTQVVVFPFDAPTTGEGKASQQRLSRAISLWKGVRPADQFRVAEVTQAGAPVSDAEARRVAQKLSIGRYVRGRISPASDGNSAPSVYAALYDVNAGRLSDATTTIKAETSAESVFVALADSLLLRGALVDNGRSGSLRNLPEAQSMSRGSRALNDWDLSGADSAFGRAAGFDSSARRPLLWQAQVREWAGKASTSWLAEARESSSDSASLSATERRMAEALVAIGIADYPAACRAYSSIVARDSASFVGWYGLGECQSRDKLVIPDRSSRTGWRFRASYHQALIAYARAFDLLPATYRGFQGNAYERLRSLLKLNSRSLLAGKTATVPPEMMWARVALVHDTIVAVPAPTGEFQAGHSPVDLQDNARSIVYLRRLFKRIATSWGEAFPQSAEAKEAVAVALEMDGDPAAVDSLAAVLRLSSDSTTQVRVAAAQLLMRMKFAVPEDTTTLISVRAAAESLLAAHPGASVAEASALAPLAAMLGRCATAAQLLHKAATPIAGAVEIPAALAGDAHARLAYVAIGCPTPADVPTVDQIASRLDALGPSDATRVAEESLIPQILALSDDPTIEWLDRFAETRDYILIARAQALRRRPDSVRMTLARVDAGRRSAFAGDVTPDAVLPEAILYLGIRDTASAVRVLDAMLSTARDHAPVGADEAHYTVTWVGTLVRSMALRGRLPTSQSSNDPAWSRAALILLRDKDIK